MALSITHGYLLGRIWLLGLHSEAERDRVDTERKGFRLDFFASVAGPLYYISLIAFAHSLFPYVPAIRGGGDYTTGPQVATILLKNANTSCGTVPSSICAGIVEETSSTVYIIEKDLWKPCMWRNKTKRIPFPIAINRDLILSIKYPSELDRPTDYFTSNINGYGIYQMDVGNVPFNKVNDAIDEGYWFTRDDESSRYFKDYNYCPSS